MTVLKQGSSGPSVRDLQQRLSDLGFAPKGIDGNFGPGTEAAVRAFQAAAIARTFTVIYDDLLV